ncbi:MAG: extracellular solute-binding protein [Lachnospiraceae bacterium]|nr:extracellular solute-binding protein [Lachnospiraceae bacterium]MCI9676096.1 extracellular solute-binding protein [Lachnospiraceae bacterium]
MKKKAISILLAGAMVMSMAACGDTGSDSSSAASGSSAGAAGSSSAGSSAADAGNATGELVDGRFAETRTITVEVYNRENDGGSDPTNNMYTEYIKKGMLEDHNVQVEFVSVPRWTEVEQINNLLAAGDAPDICVTYDYPTIQTYANMGGVLDLAPYLEEYKSELPNLWDWLGEMNLYWDRDPEEGTVWGIEAKLAVSNRINTFVRQDWLDALNLEAPTTKQEFEEMLIAFRDNADTLLGADADKMIPYSVSYDVGWRAATLIESFIDPDITDREFYVNGFDDRKLTQEGTKEAIRLLNKWYNEGLLWDDFALYGSGDSTEDDMMKAGYIGAFTHNWDYPFRNGEDSINASLQRIVGEDAVFVAVDCFEDKNGNYTKFVPGPIDRKIFFPSTNDEPLACMLYLDWISDPEHIEYLQIGDEGVTHNVLEDGAVETVAATGEAIQNSGMNIDYTITCNGLKLADEEKTVKSRSHNYAGIDASIVEAADRIANTDMRVGKNVNVGAIATEEGMGPVLSEKRDIVYDNAVIAPVADFDKVWDQGVQDYLNAGGQAIMDEREEKWVATYGDVDMLP